jgi:hypothetical protein
LTTAPPVTAGELLSGETGVTASADTVAELLPDDVGAIEADVVEAGPVAAALELEEELWHPAVSATAPAAMATAAGKTAGRRARVSEVIWSPNLGET